MSRSCLVPMAWISLGHYGLVWLLSKRSSHKGVLSTLDSVGLFIYILPLPPSPRFQLL